MYVPSILVVQYLSYCYIIASVYTAKLQSTLYNYIHALFSKLLKPVCNIMENMCTCNPLYAMF